MSLPRRDWWLDACRIARACPGLGNPWDLTLAQWNAVLDRLTDLYEDEHPPTSDAESALRILSQQRREERRNHGR